MDPGNPARPLRLCWGRPQWVGHSICNQDQDLRMRWGGGGRGRCRASTRHTRYLGNAPPWSCGSAGKHCLYHGPRRLVKAFFGCSLSVLKPLTSVWRNVTRRTSSSQVPFPQPSSVSPAAPSATCPQPAPCSQDGLSIRVHTLQQNTDVWTFLF